MNQIALPLDWRSASGAQGFILSDANRDAVRQLEHFALWPVRACMLVGPSKSGRSHLARLFQTWSSGVVIDDAEAADETMLFHAWNAAQETRRPLLIVAAAPPRRWAVTLPDLASRLSATPVATIHPPDDALLGAVMAKQLRDRNLDAAPEVVAYVLGRIERSFEHVASAVAGLDRAALSAHRRLTVPLARQVLMEQGVIQG
jgi:hypothetical protein